MTGGPLNCASHPQPTTVRGIFCLVAALTLLLTSCPNPITVELATQINDTTGPVITITEPADRSEYSTVVRVTGTVTNSADATTAAQIVACSYSVPGTSVSGSFEINEVGTFSFLFATRDADGTTLVAGPAIIQITARDWNGNESTASVQIVPVAAGDVPGFTVTPASGEVTIAWSDVPGAESYDLFEFNYGESRTDVAGPYTWTGLENGAVYAFQLTARMADGSGDDAVSAAIETMPLSPRTLAPWIREVGYRSITLEWRANPNASPYTVERSLSPGGPWEVRRRLSGNVFTDAKVDHDTGYYYRVSPAEFRDIPSDYQAAVPGRFGENLVVRDTTGDASRVAIAGSYAYVADYDSGLAIIDISDPTNPGTPVYADTTGDARGVAVAGSYAYVADSGSGLAIIDISEPTNPGVPVYADTTGYACGVAVAGSYAYVADGSSGLAIIDLLGGE